MAQEDAEPRASERDGGCSAVKATAEAVKAAPGRLKDDVAAEAVQAVLSARSSEHADIAQRLERLELRFLKPRPKRCGRY